MSQDVFDTINPDTTSGNQLATILNSFKGAMMSGLIGPSRPTELEAGGSWIDDSLQLSLNVWDFKVYTGTADITVFRLNLATGTPSIVGSENTFEVTRISADSVGPIFKLIKERVAANGQTLFGDTLGEIQFQSTTNSGTNEVSVRIRAIATDTAVATELGATLVFEAINTDSNTLAEVMRIMDGKLGLGLVNPEEKLHVSGNIRADRVGDDAIGAKKILKKKRVSGNGQVLNNDIIAVEEYHSTDEAGNDITVAAIEVSAKEDHTGTAQGTKIVFKTKTVGSTVFAEQIIIDGDVVDIPNLKIGTVTNLELGYLDGVTSSIQTQLNAKATPADITAAINALINGAGAALDTLKELADALGNDANFATTISTALANRLRVDTAAQGLTGTEKTNAKTNLDLQNVDNTSDATKNAAAVILTNKTIVGANIQGPVRLDAKSDTKANLITYATTAANGELLYATDTKTYHGVKDGQLVDIGGGGGVGGVDIIFTDTAEAANLTDYTQTGLEITETPITLHATKSFRFVHASGSEKNMKSVKPVDVKFRGKSATFSLDVVATTTSGNATILFRDETNNADIGVAQVISTGSSAITATTANASNSMVLSDRAVFNTLKEGMLVTGSAIPNGTIISALDSATMTATLSQNATGVATGIRVSSLTIKRDFTILIPAKCASISYTVKALAEANNATIYFDDAVFQLAEYAKTTATANFSVPSKVVHQIKLTGGSSAGPTITNWSVASNDNTGVMSAPSGGVITLQKAATVNITISGNGGSANQGPAIAIDGTQVLAQTNSTSGQGEHVSITLNLNAGQTISFLGSISAGSAWIVATADTTVSTSTSFALTSSVLVTQPDSIFRMTGFQTLRKTGATNAFYLSGGTIQQNVGNAITIINSASEGLRIIANVAGNYSISYQQNATSTATTPAFYKGVLDSTAEAARVTMFGYDLASGGLAHISGTVYLEKDEYITLQGDTTSTDTSYAFLSVALSGAMKQINPSTDQKVEIPTHELRFEGCSANGTGAESATAQFTSLTKLRGDGLEVSNSNGTIITVKKKGFLTINTNITQGDRYLSKNQVVNTTYPTSAERLTRAYQNTTYVAPMGWSGPVEVGDKIRVNGDAPSGTTANTLSMSLMETSVAVALQNVSPRWDDSDSAVRVQGGNGFGSANTLIRRYSNTLDNFGTDVTYADSVTLGGSFTINKDGIYNIYATEQNSGTGIYDLAITKNQTTTSSGANLLAISDTSTVSGNVVNVAASGVYLQRGDIVRIANSTPANVSTSTIYAIASITRVGKTSGSVDVTPFVNIPQSEIEAIEALNPTTTWGSVNTGVPVLSITRNTSRGIIQILSDSSSGTSFKALKDCTVFLSARLVNNTATDSLTGLTRNATTLTTAGFDGELVSESVNTSGGYVNLSTSVVLSAGDVLRVQRASTNITVAAKVFLTAIATPNSVTVPTQQVSSDTMNFVFKATTIDPNTDPVGTFNTYKKAINTGVSAVLCTTAPTQSIASMNSDGIRLFSANYATATTDAQPSAVSVFIGKGLKSKEVNAFLSAGKTTQLVTDTLMYGTNTQSGAQINYNETTGVLRIELGDNYSSAVVTRSLYEAITGTSNLNGYFVFHASKTPSLVSIPNMTTRVAYLSDVKASGSGGGSTVATTWTTRDLNTLVDNTGIVTSLSSNQFTLPAGTYSLDFFGLTAQSASGVSGHRIRNITDGTTALVGQTYTGGSGTDIISGGNGEISITSPKTFALQYYVTNAQATSGLGQNGTISGEANTFSRIKITKIK